MSGLRCAVRVDGAGSFLRAELTIEREDIPITEAHMMRPDPSWVLVDDAGHYHRWADDGGLPTLERTSRHVDCLGCSGGWDDDDAELDPCAGHDVPFYRCLICHVEIEPGMVATPPRQLWIPGRSTWRVDVEYPDGAGVRLVSGERVSVVSEPVPSAAGRDAVLFGVALVSRVSFGTGDDTITRAELVGAGPLGRAWPVSAETASAAT